MAEYVLAGGTPVTVFSPTSGAYGGAGVTLSQVSISDGDPSNNEFDTTESLTMTTGSSPPSSVTFRGTVNIGGIDYPVFRLGNDQVFGIALDSTTYPNFASLGTLTNTPLTVDFCFAAGTEIATPEGFTLVEHLQIGELISRAEGGAVPVKWIGRQSQHKLLAGTRLQPVRIRAGALGDGLPHRDLTVTADHGMVFPSSSKAVGETKNDGYVINASALINGHTIDWVPMEELPDSVTYYHIETEAHDVILANSAPSETFIDAAGRAAFDNHQEYLDLYGAERIIPEMSMPRITSARLLPQAIKDRLGVCGPAPLAKVS